MIPVAEAKSGTKAMKQMIPSVNLFFVTDHLRGLCVPSNDVCRSTIEHSLSTERCESSWLGAACRGRESDSDIVAKSIIVVVKGSRRVMRPSRRAMREGPRKIYLPQDGSDAKSILGEPKPDHFVVKSASLADPCICEDGLE